MSSSPIRIAINGYGRIGRIVHRQALLHPERFLVVAANSRTSAEENAHLLHYDSLFGRLPHPVTSDATSFTVAGQRVANLTGDAGKDYQWSDYGVDVVVESTGAFRTTEKMQFHLNAGAKKVVLSAPADDDTPTFVIGVNHERYNGETIVSNASCTTNCLAPVAKVLHEAFGIQKAMMSTIHAFTNDQNMHDGAHKDPRRARAMLPSIIPTKTGVASALKKVLPDIAEAFDGLSIRVPVPVVSLVDLTALVSKDTTKEAVNQALRDAAHTPALAGILAVEDAPLVSIDFKGDTHSATVDSRETKVTGGNLIKVLAWYDNEYGYSARMLDLIAHISR